MRIHSGYLLRELGDDHLVIGMETGVSCRAKRVVKLNESAAFLWRSVAGKDFDAADLAVLLQEEYGLDSTTAAADAGSIAKAWMQSGLVDA
jgi:hypothetical protein